MSRSRRARGWPLLARRMSLLAATALLIACVPVRRPQAPFPRTVIDGSGASLVIAAAPARVARLGEVPLLAALLPPDAIAALDPLQPPDAIAWQGIGLLVVSSGVAAAYPGWISGSEAAEVPVFRLGTIHSLEDWRDTVRALGAATGRDRAAARLLRRLAAAERIAASLAHGRAPLRVLVLTPEGYTLGQGTLFTDLLARAGAINVAAEAGFADIRQIDDSAIGALAPEVILLAPAWGAEGRAALLANPAYARLPAVQTDRVVLLPFEPSRIVRPAVPLLWLALMLHSPS